MITQITPALKDEILSDFTGYLSSFYIEPTSECSKYGLNETEFTILLDSFEDQKLIRQQKAIGGILITQTPQLIDFVQHGGFSAQEETYQMKLQQLALEIEVLSKELKPKQLDRLQKITSIINSLWSVCLSVKP